MEKENKAREQRLQRADEEHHQILEWMEQGKQEEIKKRLQKNVEFNLAWIKKRF